MGKVKFVDILLDNPLGVFHPGGQVKGKVALEVEEDTKVSKITINLHGYATVHFTETKTVGTKKNRRTVTKHYRSNENYINRVLVILSPDRMKGQNDVILTPGHYAYPFEFQLPASCGTSFEGSIGRVRYYLHATVDRPWAFDNERKLPFTVINQMDLNKHQKATHTSENEDWKNVCCWCCASGPITGRVKLERLGYVPGEAIPLIAECCNYSNRNVKYTEMQIEMHSTYKAQGKTRYDNSVVAAVRRGKVSSGGGREVWEGDLGMIVPPLPPTGLPGCKIIDVEYYVKYQITPRGLAMDLNVYVPLIIGSIPLKSTVEKCGAPPPRPPPQPLAPPEGPGGAIYDASLAYPPPPPDYPPNMPPPSYQMSGLVIAGDDDNEIDDDQPPPPSNAVRPQPYDVWAPSYTYYNWHEADPNFKVRPVK